MKRMNSQTNWTPVGRTGNKSIGTKNEPHISAFHTPNYYAGLTNDTPTKPTEAVLDSGATHTFFPATYKTNNEQLNRQGE